MSIPQPFTQQPAIGKLQIPQQMARRLLLEFLFGANPILPLKANMD
jgi:hypothetical protein